MATNSCSVTGQLIRSAMDATYSENGGENALISEPVQPIPDQAILQQQELLQQQLQHLQHQQQMVEMQLSQLLTQYHMPPQPHLQQQPQQQLPQQPQLQGTQEHGSEHKRKRSRSPEEDISRYNIPVSNRYKLLGTLETNEEPENDPIIKIPPIIVHNASNFQLLLNDIKKNVKDDFTTKQEKDAIKISFTSISDYRSFRKFCETEKIEFHSYKDPSIKTLAVVMKDIPTTYSESEILQELIRLKFPAIKVARLYNKDKCPIPICAIDLENTYQSKEIFKLNRFLYSVIRIQKRIKSHVIQCKRCQRFGHSQANCGLQPRCVKCTGQHHYSECTKIKSAPPKCVNCGDEHTANYKGCSIYKKAADPMKNSKNIHPPSNVSHQTIIHPNNVSARQVPSHPTLHPNPYHNNQSRSYSSLFKQDQSNLISNIVSQVMLALTPIIENTVKSVLTNLNYGK